MTPIHVILVNGPPRAGKDTAVDRLKKLGFVEVKYSQPLKDASVALTGITFEMLESQKDQPLYPTRSDKTFRDLQISLSEVTFKPLFGEDAFGFLCAQRILALHNTTGATKFAVSDSGFTTESIPMVEQFGADNVVVFKVNRDGCDFSKDSRDWLDLTDMGVRHFDITNNGTISEFHDLVEQYARDAFRPIETERGYRIGYGYVPDDIANAVRALLAGSRARRVWETTWDGPVGSKGKNTTVVREMVAEMVAEIIAAMGASVHVKSVVVSQTSDPDYGDNAGGLIRVTLDKL